MPESRVSLSHYALLVGLPVVLVLAMIKVGTVTLPVIPALTDVFPEVARNAPASSQRGFTLGLLVGQLVVVLLAAQAFGWIARRLGQPTVVGEMVAGIVLGPSVIGALQPQWTAALFPTGSLGFLNALSQLGVLLFLFVVGLHVDLRSLRRQSGTAVIASHASIAAPFTLGVLLAFWLFPRFSPRGVPFAAFALFVGVAMSVTAFPVLARILEERGMLRLTRTRVISQRVPSATMAIIMIAVLLSAFATELLGIHALFGALVAGAVMPRENGFNNQMADQLSDLLVVLLLPLFFAYTGLRTHFDLLGGFDDLIFLVAILAVAIGGKVFGTAIAARAGGQPWREATVLGLLMNTRGLMELVVLNIGLDLGVLSPRLFAMMVIMALITTAMTVPAIAVYDRWRKPTAFA